MVDRVEIRSPFIVQGPDCELPDDCIDFCQRAFAMYQEAKYELDGPGRSSLPYQLNSRKCRNPQCLEMKVVGEKLLEESKKSP